MALIDSFGRRINYLRLSVTDRCNFRCCYCMPACGVPKVTHNDILRFEDLIRIAREAVLLGVEKIRITGGEPLVRKGTVEFLARLSQLDGLKELTLTTNGTLLATTAARLRYAGVTRLNVSLDSLRPQTFATITRGGDLYAVLDGIRAAEDAGLSPLKINMVVMRGINDDELVEFAELTFRRPYSVRFIEFMPTGQQMDWGNRFVSGREILDLLASRYTLTALASTPAHPAKTFQLKGALGTIGVITAVSDHFCDGCNRIRVTATGIAKSCLFAIRGMDLKPSLLAGDAELRSALQRVICEKPLRHPPLERIGASSPFAMVQIGG
jgi:GTP 3',8-cyclase